MKKLTPVELTPERKAAIIQAARDEYCNENLEIDDEPEVSEADRGCWVAAWVWVDPKPAQKVDPQMLQRVKDFVAADLARINKGKKI